MGRLKQPKPQGHGKIRVPEAQTVDPNTLRVVFGFRYIVRGYDLSDATPAQSRGLIHGLRMRSGLTWAELRMQRREQLGSEKIAPAIRVGIPDNVPPEKRPELICFRFGGDMERFIGFQDGATLEIVWI